MDVQILLAENYRELGKYAEAEQHLKTAATMCPARFMPLYELAKLYEATNRMDEALAMAEIIVAKSVKVPSHTVTAIKNEMRQLLVLRGSPVRETEVIEAREINRETDESENDDTRQGETPEQGAALPP